MTTCYANPQAEEGKRGEGEWTGKTVSTGTVCLCAHWQEGLCACRFVYVSVCCDCVFIVCFGREMSCGTFDSRVGIASV